MSCQNDGNKELCFICNVHICHIYLLMGNMKPHIKILGCEQPDAIYLFTPSSSAEFTYIFIININLST